MNNRRPVKTLLSILSFSIIFYGAQAFAQPSSVPPGLLSAPPCLDPGRMPSQAKVPCAAILQFSEGSTPEQRIEKVKNHGATMRFNYNHLPAAAVYVSDEEVLDRMLSDDEIENVIPDRV